MYLVEKREFDISVTDILGLGLVDVAEYFKHQNIIEYLAETTVREEKKRIELKKEELLKIEIISFDDFLSNKKTSNVSNIPQKDSQDLIDLINILSEKIDENSLDYSSILERGQALYKIGNYPKSVVDLGRVITNTKNVEAYFLRGMCYMKFKKPECAICDFEKVKESKPREYLAFYHKALVLIQQKRTREAMEELRFCVETCSDVSVLVYCLLSRLCYQEETWKYCVGTTGLMIEAEELLNEALIKFPDLKMYVFLQRILQRFEFVGPRLPNMKNESLKDCSELPHYWINKILFDIFQFRHLRDREGESISQILEDQSFGDVEEMVDDMRGIFEWCSLEVKKTQDYFKYPGFQTEIARIRFRPFPMNGDVTDQELFEKMQKSGVYRSSMENSYLLDIFNDRQRIKMEGFFLNEYMISIGMIPCADSLEVMASLDICALLVRCIEKLFHRHQLYSLCSNGLYLGMRVCYDPISGRVSCGGMENAYIGGNEHRNRFMIRKDRFFRRHVGEKLNNPGEIVDFSNLDLVLLGTEVFWRIKSRFATVYRGLLDFLDGIGIFRERIKLYYPGNQRIRIEKLSAKMKTSIGWEVARKEIRRIHKKLLSKDEKTKDMKNQSERDERERIRYVQDQILCCGDFATTREFRINFESFSMAAAKFMFLDGTRRYLFKTHDIERIDDLDEKWKVTGLKGEQYIEFLIPPGIEDSSTKMDFGGRESLRTGKMEKYFQFSYFILRLSKWKDFGVYLRITDREEKKRIESMNKRIELKKEELLKFEVINFDDFLSNKKSSKISPMHTQDLIDLINILSEKIEKKSTDYASILERGQALYNIGDYSKSVVDLGRVIWYTKNVEAYFLRGMSYLKSNNLSDAIRDFEKVQKSKPKKYLAYYNKALARVQQKRTREAMDELRYCVKNCNDVSVLVFCLLSRLCYQEEVWKHCVGHSGLMIEAEELLNEALIKFPDLKMYVFLQRILQRFEFVGPRLPNMKNESLKDCSELPHYWINKILFDIFQFRHLKDGEEENHENISRILGDPSFGDVEEMVDDMSDIFEWCSLEVKKKEYFEIESFHTEIARIRFRPFPMNGDVTDQELFEKMEKSGVYYVEKNYLLDIFSDRRRIKLEGFFLKEFMISRGMITYRPYMRHLFYCGVREEMTSLDICSLLVRYIEVLLHRHRLCSLCSDGFHLGMCVQAYYDPISGRVSFGGLENAYIGGNASLEHWNRFMMRKDTFFRVSDLKNPDMIVDFSNLDLVLLGSIISSNIKSRCAQVYRGLLDFLERIGVFREMNKLIHPHLYEDRKSELIEKLLAKMKTSVGLEVARKEIRRIHKKLLSKDEKTRDMNQSEEDEGERIRYLQDQILSCGDFATTREFQINFESFSMAAAKFMFLDDTRRFLLDFDTTILSRWHIDRLIEKKIGRIGDKIVLSFNDHAHSIKEILKLRDEGEVSLEFCGKVCKYVDIGRVDDLDEKWKVKGTKCEKYIEFLIPPGIEDFTTRGIFWVYLGIGGLRVYSKVSLPF